MKPLLARRNVELLSQFAWCRVLLAFDYDGTLAPIVARRDAAYMRADTERLLRHVCELYPCAVISGRPQRDLRRRLAAARVPFVLGNHGLELGEEPDEFATQVAAALSQLQLALGGSRAWKSKKRRTRSPSTTDVAGDAEREAGVAALCELLAQDAVVIAALLNAAALERAREALEARMRFVFGVGSSEPSDEEPGSGS